MTNHENIFYSDIYIVYKNAGLF